MGDLRKDLETCNQATPGPWKRNEKPSFGDWWVYVGGQHICLLPADKKGTHFGEMFKSNAEFIAAAREGWPHAIERAIKAEAEVERLQKVYAITNESWKKQVEENALLRKVAEAGEKAIKTLDNTCYLFAKADDRAIHNEAVKMFWQALAELDKEGAE